MRAASVDETSLTLNLGGTVVVTLKDDDPAVEINIGDGSGIIKIEQDGTINITSQKALKVKIDGDVDIEAGGKLNLKGSTINLN